MFNYRNSEIEKKIIQKAYTGLVSFFFFFLSRADHLPESHRSKTGRGLGKSKTFWYSSYLDVKEQTPQISIFPCSLT